MENKVHQMRICPVCGKNLFHKDIRSFKLAIKLNKKCVSCANSEKQFSNHIFAENDNYFDKSTSLKRTCSIYNKDIYYKNIYNFNNAIINNSLCKSCCVKGIKRPYAPNLQIRGKKHWTYGKSRKKETVEKIKKTLTGRKLTFEHRKNISNAVKQRICTDETRQKLKISARKRILKQLDNIYGHSCFNPIACKYFDGLNEKNGWNLQHALNGREVQI